MPAVTYAVNFPLVRCISSQPGAFGNFGGYIFAIVSSLCDCTLWELPLSNRGIIREAVFVHVIGTDRVIRF